MAPRKPKTATPAAETTEAPATVTEENTVSTETIETPVEDVPTEAVEATTEAAPVEDVKEEVEIDLTAFNEALAAAVAERDTSTGDIPEALVSPVVSEYRALPGSKGKSAAKKLVDDAMRQAMNDADMPLARANLQISGKLVAGSSRSGGKTAAEKTPVDPTEAHVEIAAGLRLATNAAYANAPEGVAEDWSERVEKVIGEQTDNVNAFIAWLTSDDNEAPEPEVPSFVKAAAKLALGKSAKVGTARRSAGTSTYEGERRDVAKHIAEAFADVEAGTFLSIADIRNHKSSEYGNDAPSAGAVSARLFPKNGKVTIEGIKPDTNDKGTKGAVKL